MRPRAARALAFVALVAGHCLTLQVPVIGTLPNSLKAALGLLERSGARERCDRALAALPRAHGRADMSETKRLQRSERQGAPWSEPAGGGTSTRLALGRLAVPGTLLLRSMSAGAISSLPRLSPPSRRASRPALPQTRSWAAAGSRRSSTSTACCANGTWGRAWRARRCAMRRCRLRPPLCRPPACPSLSPSVNVQSGRVARCSRLDEATGQPAVVSSGTCRLWCCCCAVAGAAAAHGCQASHGVHAASLACLQRPPRVCEPGAPTGAMPVLRCAPNRLYRCMCCGRMMARGTKGSLRSVTWQPKRQAAAQPGRACLQQQWGGEHTQTRL